MPVISIPFVPWSIAGGFMLLVLAVLSLLSVGLYRAMRIRGGSENQGRKVAFFAAGGVILWLLLTGILTRIGFFADFKSIPPHTAFGLIPAIVTVFLVTNLPKTRALLLAIPAAWVIGFQMFRIGAEFALLGLFHYGAVPRSMTFEGSNLDMLTGLTALPVALLLAKGKLPRPVAILWNIMGLVLLINVIRIALSAIPNPLVPATSDIPNMAVAIFPFIYLPFYLVPMALLGHIISLRQLLAQRTQTTQGRTIAGPLVSVAE